MNTKSRRGAQFLLAALLASVQRTGCVWGPKLVIWVKIRQLVSTRGRTFNTNLKNSQSCALYSQSCVFNSWTFLLHQLPEMQTPYKFPSPSTNIAVFRKIQRLLWWKKYSSSSKLRESQKPLSWEGQVGLSPLRRGTAFDSWCILKPAGTASHSKEKHRKHGLIQNLRFFVAMRTDLTA